MSDVSGLVTCTNLHTLNLSYTQVSVVLGLATSLFRVFLYDMAIPQAPYVYPSLIQRIWDARLAEWLRTLGTQFRAFQHSNKRVKL